MLDEVDGRILEIRKDLNVKVCHMPQSVEQQKRYVKALISLEVHYNNINYYYLIFFINFPFNIPYTIIICIFFFISKLR